MTAGTILLLFTFTFFYIAFFFILKTYGFAHPVSLIIGMASCALLVVCITGFRNHQSGFGTYSYHESELFLNLDTSTGGGNAMDRYATQVTGPAYMLSQIFLSAPLQCLKGLDRLRSLIRDDPKLDQGLRILLEEINTNGKWHPIKNYQDRPEEISYLIQMHAVQFSPRKGLVHRN